MKSAKTLTTMLAFAAFGLALAACEITTSTAECGNAVCESSESCSTCPGDCGACTSCGNHVCETGETCTNCPTDCSCVVCGNSICEAGETYLNCPADCDEPTTCGNGTCDAGETYATCPADCTCGNGTCEADESCVTCTADCGTCTTEATVSFTWYIHGVQGGVDVGWGTGVAQEVCQLAQDLSGLTAPPVVQIWLEETGDDVADTRIDFVCSAGQGTSSAFWDAGDSIKYAFALVDGSGALISQSTAWETQTLVAGNNDLGTTDFYIGEYGPLGVELQWANQITGPTYGDCAFPTNDVTKLGYLLCWGSLSGGNCPEGMLYDEVNIDVEPATCTTDLRWDITDFGTYTLVIDGEDAAGTTLWGFECQDLIVDDEEPESNEFICQVLMTVTP
jgi:hypothetical protein